MAEKETITKSKIKYEGLLDVGLLYKLVDNWLKENYYDQVEKDNTELVTPDGRDIDIWLEPYKKISDYSKYVIRIIISMVKVKDVETEIDMVKVKTNKAIVNILLVGYLETDWENRWQQRPIHFFLRTLFDKYVYRLYIERSKSEVTEEVNSLRDSIKGFLNLYRYHK